MTGSRGVNMIFVTGDTHRSDLLYLRVFCDRHPELTKNDYVIIAGDFGGVWANETLERDLKQFSDLPVTVLFVDGNHENFDLLNAYPVEMWHGGKIHKIKPDIIHLMRGQVFEIEGKTFFTFGGATSIDKDYRVEGKSWWQQELPTFEELDEGISNLKKHGNQVDYIITHSCSERALAYSAIRNGATVKFHCPEVQMLSYIEESTSFRHWYFGHFHIDAELSDKYTALLHNVAEIKL